MGGENGFFTRLHTVHQRILSFSYRVTAQMGSENEAVQSLIDLAQKYSGEVVIAAIEPLTNIALAILLDPNFLSHVKTLVVACAGPTINSCQYDLTGHSPSNSAFH
ncbi:hypothetical protein PsorP6_014670 [Peronosclerospora sorghi]|uniref:Uncharacterized protein n=1 Tax=Peronosclerospora sorghi TaxID=230839 RepID=A0ACC0VTJ2_9STRA|nr:hypothetical protein PsorP6_014670 [Peronosclerospora sorghi]